MTPEDSFYDATLYAEDDPDEVDIVAWHETDPVTVPLAVATGALVAAFAFGALTAVGVLALTGRLDD